MLAEPDCRRLSMAVDAFMEDFDPKDAIHFFEAKSIITQDQADMIEMKYSRLERLRDFLRYYRRQADTLDPLKDFFERSCQPQLVDFLNNNIVSLESSSLPSPSCFSTERRLRKLQQGLLPIARRHVKRKELSNLESLLKERSLLGSDSFVVGVCGCAGSGKTSLIADVLLNSEGLVGEYFENTYFVRDSNTDADMIRCVFAELLLLLKDNTEYMSAVGAKNLSRTALTKHIIDALIDRPNTLIIIDDVRSVDTIRWVNQLGIRCVITTRNSDLFSAATASMDLVTLSGLDAEETKQLVLESDKSWNAMNEAHLDTIRRAHNITSGNAALLGKLCKMAAGKPSRFAEYLNIINVSGFSCLDCITSYQHRSIYVTMSQFVDDMDEADRQALACCVVLPPDVWIPIEVWSFVIPVDITGSDSVDTLVFEQLNRLMVIGSWVDEYTDMNGVSFYRIPNLVTLFLKEVVQRNTIQVLSRKILSVANRSASNCPLAFFFQKNSDWFVGISNNLCLKIMDHSIHGAEPRYNSYCSIL